MTIAWMPNLSVNDSQIDEQHKQLISKINELLEATKTGKGKEKINEIINFLGQYTINHFSHEERYMIEHHYPELDSHKKIHEEFIKKFLEFKNKISKEGASASLTIEVQHFLGDWLINHIGKEDHKYAEYILKS